MDPRRERQETPHDPVASSRGRLESAGPLAMAVGLGVNGLAAYVFLTAAARSLGAEDSGQVAVLWPVLWTVGMGLFLPLEQELSRSISARRARDQDWGALVAQVSRFGAWLFGGVAVVLLATSTLLADALFRGDVGFVLVLVYGVGGVAVSYVVRGLLAGSGRYLGYAGFYLTDAAFKAVPALLFLAAGVDLPMAFALTVATSALVASAAPMSRGARLGPPGEKAEATALRRSLVYLVLTAFFSALVLNFGTVLVELLATPSEEDKASVFLSGLVMSRIPVFFFQAVQAIVLPRLSHSAAAGDMASFRSLLRLLVLAIAGLTVVGVPIAAAVGPKVVEILFGSDFVLSARDMAMLTLASMLMLVALTFNQAQLALHHQHETGWPWALAAVVLVVVTLLAGSDLLLRVEIGLVASGASVAIVAGVLLGRELHHPDENRDAAEAL